LTLKEKEMRIVTLAQQKGGVGKTTVCFNLATQAAARGKTAAILDMDVDQGSATKWGLRRKAAARASPEIAVYSAKSANLAAKLAELKTAGVDWVFLDLPGRDAPASSAGLKVADFILVPCRPLEDDVEPSLNTVGLIRRGGGKYAYLLNISPPQLDKARARKVAAELTKAGHLVSPVIIVQRIGVPDANAKGMGVNESSPASLSAVEYSDLFEWIEGQLS
jgi:chromosome partitioning protein